MKRAPVETLAPSFFVVPNLDIISILYTTYSMKKIFLLGALLATLLFVSVPAYACLPTYGNNEYSEPPKMGGWIATHSSALPMNTGGYTPVLPIGESSCGTTMVYVKNELLIVIITVSGVLAGVVITLFLRREHTKK